MSRQEIHLELMLGKRVYALNGRNIGRLEEVCAEVHEGVATVEKFLVGTYAICERLSAWEIGRTIMGLLGSRIKSGYCVRWDQIDLSDPKRLKLTCQVSELSPLEVNKS
jgi:sporulation protein YlmC with PRC-barrel domain